MSTTGPLVVEMSQRSKLELSRIDAASIVSTNTRGMYFDLNVLSSITRKTLRCESTTMAGTSRRWFAKCAEVRYKWWRLRSERRKSCWATHLKWFTVKLCAGTENGIGRCRLKDAVVFKEMLPGNSVIHVAFSKKNTHILFLIRSLIRHKCLMTSKLDDFRNDTLCKWIFKSGSYLYL